MNKIIFPLAVCLSVMFFFASCLKDDEVETVYSDDAAIVSFTLGNLNSYITTKASDGTDSVYKATVTGSNYKMYIDQMNHLIYNVDSLPYNTDVSRVLCTVTSKNSGLIVIQNVGSDTLRYYSSTDSIDFTTPRKFIAYSVDGSAHQEYTVSLNVHGESSDKFVWNSSDISLPVEPKGMKALSCNGRVFVFISDGSQTTLVSCDEQSEDGWQWATPNLNTTLPSYAYQNVVTRDGYLYLYADGRILKSADGNTWEETARAGIMRLAAASERSLYAISHSGALLRSDDEGATWREEKLDDSSTLLPVQDISYCVLPSRVNDSTEYVVMAGNRSLTGYPGDRFAMVWSKVEEYAAGSRDDGWTYTSACDVDSVALPRLSHLTIASCDGAIVALGSAGIGACETPGFKRLYYSQDGGVYWLNNAYYQLPDGFVGQDVFAMTVDSLHRLWIITAEGKVWRGYYPYTMWEKHPKSFTE